MSFQCHYNYCTAPPGYRCHGNGVTVVYLRVSSPVPSHHCERKYQLLEEDDCERDSRYSHCQERNPNLPGAAGELTHGELWIYHGMPVASAGWLGVCNRYNAGPVHPDSNGMDFPAQGFSGFGLAEDCKHPWGLDSGIYQ